MRFLFASDSFKGTLSSAQTAALLKEAAEEVFGDAVTCDSLPVADGGEGTAEAVTSACGGTFITVPVHGPLDRAERSVEARYGDLGGGKAILEMASASGLTLVPMDRLDPLMASSAGTGEMILDALDRGFTDISIAIGGSATNDGGMGCARALGVRFLDADGAELQGRGIDLEQVRTIDISGLDPRIAGTRITVMCDVTNPLCGGNGATYTFGPQKGASPDVLARLEKGMCNYRDVIRRTFHTDPDALTGAGAAGGLGTALTVFLGGEMRSGINTVLDLVGFDRRLEGVDLVITGEGQTDWQSSFGKVLQGVGERAKAAGVPAVALCGSLGPGAENIYEHGIETLFTTVDAPMPLNEALDHAEEMYRRGAVRLMRALRTGMMLSSRR